MTFLLVGINILVFIISQAAGMAFYQAGVLYPMSVFWNGEYWRVVTAFFLHADFMHLFNNMVTLLFLGMMLEEMYGKKILAVSYLVAGLGGNIVSLLYKYLSYNFVGSVGASGAIFGLDGLLLAKVLFNRGYNSGLNPARVMFMIFLSLYSGFASPGIDNSAHVGGLVVGFLVGAIDSGIKSYRIKKKYFR